MLVVEEEAAAEAVKVGEQDQRSALRLTQGGRVLVNSTRSTPLKATSLPQCTRPQFLHPLN